MFDRVLNTLLHGFVEHWKINPRIQNHLIVSWPIQPFILPVSEAATVGVVKKIVHKNFPNMTGGVGC